MEVCRLLFAFGAGIQRKQTAAKPSFDIPKGKIYKNLESNKFKKYMRVFIINNILRIEKNLVHTS